MKENRLCRIEGGSGGEAEHDRTKLHSIPSTCEDVIVDYDGFKALNNLNFIVHYSELRVVIGPNGAGKTTLLDVICGKTKPTSGRVIFGQGHGSHRQMQRMKSPSWASGGSSRRRRSMAISRCGRIWICR